MYKEIFYNFQNNIKISDLKEAVTVTGGILGFFSFYFQFLRKFSPAITVSNYTYFTVEKIDKFRLKENEYVFPYIFVKIGINNSRNSYGAVEDIMLRVYDDHSTKPRATNYYLKQYGSDWKNFTDLTSISIPPKTFSEKTLMFATDSFTNNILSKDQLRGLKVEIYIKLSTVKKWSYLTNLHLFPASNDDLLYTEDARAMYITLGVINKEELRKDASKSFKHIKSSMYHGWWDYWYEGKKSICTYYSKMPFKYIRDFLYLTMITIQRSVEYILVNTLKRRIVLGHSTKKLRSSFRNVPNHSSTDNAFNFLKVELSSLCLASTKSPDVDVHITVRENTNNEVIFSGRRGQVKMYITGSNTIYLVSENQRQNTIEFQLQSKESILGTRYYVLNNKPIFLKVASFEIYDSLSLHLK